MIVGHNLSGRKIHFIVFLKNWLKKKYKCTKMVWCLLFLLKRWSIHRNFLRFSVVLISVMRKVLTLGSIIWVGISTNSTDNTRNNLLGLSNLYLKKEWVMMLLLIRTLKKKLWFASILDKLFLSENALNLKLSAKMILLWNLGQDLTQTKLW